MSGIKVQMAVPVNEITEEVHAIVALLDDRTSQLGDFEKMRKRRAQLVALEAICLLERQGTPQDSLDNLAAGVAQYVRAVELLPEKTPLDAKVQP